MRCKFGGFESSKILYVTRMLIFIVGDDGGHGGIF